MLNQKIVEYDYTSSGGSKGSYEDREDLNNYIDYKLNQYPTEALEIIFIENALDKYHGLRASFYVEGYMTRNPQITEAIKENHDGIIQNESGDEVVVFEPTQIKLADGTNTTFNSNNPDIRFDNGGVIKSFNKEAKIFYDKLSEEDVMLLRSWTVNYRDGHANIINAKEKGYLKVDKAYSLLLKNDNIRKVSQQFMKSIFGNNEFSVYRTYNASRVGQSGLRSYSLSKYQAKKFGNLDLDTKKITYKDVFAVPAISFKDWEDKGSFENEYEIVLLLEHNEVKKFNYGGQIASVKVNDFVILKYINDDDKQLGFLEYYFDTNGVMSIGLDKEPFNFNSEMYISIVEVEEQYRGKGIAKELIKKAISDAKEMGIEVVTLRRDSGMGCNYGSDYDNYLKKIYSSLGFVETWTKKEAELDNEKNICAMHLVLKKPIYFHLSTFELGGLYHGSPHKFEKFKAQRIGTGEGNKTFGYGMYFTDSQDIAKRYSLIPNQSSFTINGISLKDYNQFSQEQKDIILDFWREAWEMGYAETKEDFIFEILNQIERRSIILDESDEDVFDKETINEINNQSVVFKYIFDILSNAKIDIDANVYSVTVHKGKSPEQYDFIVWDMPLTQEQRDKILSNIDKINDGKSKDKIVSSLKSPDWYRLDTGEKIYEYITDSWNMGSEGDRITSNFLLDIGIDGIKFPSNSIYGGATSETAKNFNYVVFDENTVTIDNREKLVTLNNN